MENKLLNLKISILFSLLMAVSVSSCITYTKVDQSDPARQVDNATLLVLAYPEAICRTTEAAYADLLPIIGLGKNRLIRAGHACLVVAKEGSEKLQYFDNGRYIAPEGYCRVRGENTDPELKVDVKARWDGKKLANVDEILSWLYAHPEKTHGGGDLYASVCEKVNYETAMDCIYKIQEQDIIEYGPFVRGGTNCARFVTDAVYNSSLDEKVKEEVKDLYRFTPTGLGNVKAGSSYDYYYVVDENGVRKSNENLHMIQLDILFDGGKGYADYSTSGTLCPPTDVKPGKGWQWLGGLGYGAWYSVKKTNRKDLFKVSCYTAKGQLNYSALFKSSELIDLTTNFKVTYPSTFETVTLNIGDQSVVLDKVENLYPKVDMETGAEFLEN